MKIRLTKPQLILGVLLGGGVVYLAYNYFFGEEKEEERREENDERVEKQFVEPPMASKEEFKTPSQSDTGRVLVVFYKHGCPPCDDLLRTGGVWSQVMNKCQKRKINVASVDINESGVPEFVEGTPTIILDKNGQIEIFNDHRSVENIMNFAMS